jgi:hypothetical protein
MSPNSCYPCLRSVHPQGEGENINITKSQHNNYCAQSVLCYAILPAYRAGGDSRTVQRGTAAGQ